MKNYFSVKIRPELKIANFLIKFCKFSEILWFNLFQILDFDRNNLFTHFVFLNCWFWERKMFADFFFGPLKYKKKLKKYPTGELHKKRNTFSADAANHTFFDSPCILRDSNLMWSIITHSDKGKWLELDPRARRIIVLEDHDSLTIGWMLIIIIIKKFWKNLSYYSSFISTLNCDCICKHLLVVQFKTIHLWSERYAINL